MVDVLGHFGMALVWLAPAWFVFDRAETTAAFLGTFVWFGMLPDVDLLLVGAVPSLHHHGVVHTVLAVTLFAAVLGPVAGRAFVALADRAGPLDGWVRDRWLGVGVAGVWVTGVAHLFADVLSAPDASSVIEPFWPLYTERILTIDVIYYESFWARWGLLGIGVAVNLGLWYWTRRYRSRDRPAGRSSSR